VKYNIQNSIVTIKEGKLLLDNKKNSVARGYNCREK